MSQMLRESLERQGQLPAVEAGRSRRQTGRGNSHTILWGDREKLLSPSPAETCGWDTFAQPGLHFPDAPASRWGHVTRACPGNQRESAVRGVSRLRRVGGRYADFVIVSSSTCWLGASDLEDGRATTQSHRPRAPPTARTHGRVTTTRAVGSSQQPGLL